MKEKIKTHRALAIATLIGAVLFFLACLIPESELKEGASRIPFLILGSIFAVASVVFWVLLFFANRQKLLEKHNMRQFNRWLKEFEHLTKTAAELVRVVGDKKKFSKFGGLPVVPPDFEWPTENGKPIPFLLQLDFSEINQNGNLKNFPISGLMYVFVDEFVNEEFEIEHTKKILFFDNAEVLFCADKPINLQITFDEIFVVPDFIKTYPDTDDCDEAFDIYCARPHGGMDDGYDSICWENMERHLVGGWPSHVQNGGFMKDCRENEDDNWVLLLQIKSEYSKDDDNFMWGDNGVIYIYIREKDLITRNFDNIKLDMQCY